MPRSLVILFGVVSIASCHVTQSKSASKAPQVAPAPASLPDAAAPESEPLAVIIDRSGTRLGANTPVLVPLAADPSRGADAQYKRSGPNDLYLVPLAEALQRESKAGHLSGRLHLVVDSETPYRVVVEALFTAGQNDLGSYDLFEGNTRGRTVSFEAPRASDRLEPVETKLNLVALIVADGVGLKASGGNVAPGCNDVGPGITFPRRSGTIDLAAIVSCAKKLKASNPAFSSERKVIVFGNAGIPFREIMDLALALQGPSKDLFPELMFAVPR